MPEGGQHRQGDQRDDQHRDQLGADLHVSDHVLTSASLPGRWTRGRWVLVTAAAGGLRARRRTAFLLIERPRGRDGLARSYVTHGGANGNLPGAAGSPQPAFLTIVTRSRATGTSEHPPARRDPVLRSAGFPTPPLGPPGQEEHARRRPSTRGVRGLRSVGSGGAGRQPRLLRALRPPAPWSGVGRHGRRRRPRGARLQGDGPGQPGLRRADAGHPPGAPGDRAHPLLDHRRLPLGERPAGVQDQRRRGRDRPGPQRQPDQHGRPGRVAGRRGRRRRRRRRARSGPAATPT